MDNLNRKELTKLISVFVMGDGGLYMRPGAKNASFSMQLSAVNRDLAEKVCSVIGELTGCRLYELEREGRKYIQVTSQSHPMLTTIRDRIYTSDGHRGLDSHTMKLLDWEMMAYMFMFDGSAGRYAHQDGGFVTKVTLNMCRLSEAEHNFLKKEIKAKLGVEFNVNRKGKYFCLYLRKKDVDHFMDMVEPYILPSFAYKIVRTESPGWR